MKEKEIEIRSDVMHEMMSQPPGWTLRWGSTFIIVLILGLVLLSALIQYPDVIPGEVMITTKNPPLRLSSYTSGKIVSILKKENDLVRKNERMLVIENPSSEDQILALRSYLKKADSTFLQHRRIASLPLPDSSYMVGDLQQEFGALTSSFTELKTLVSDTYYSKKIQNLEKQTRQYRSLIALNERQYSLSQKALENATIKFDAQKQLYQQGAIAKMDFLREDDAYMQAQRQVQEAEKIRVQNQIALTDYEKQLNEILFEQENTIRLLTLTCKQHLSNLRNQLTSWQRNYTIESSQDGKVSFIRSLSVGEFIKQGEELFAIVPSEQMYIARLEVPASNTGKIRNGQAVNIKLANYPHNEFGQLSGIVKTTSSIPDKNNNYRVEVALPNGLTTSYNKSIEYKPEMNGSAEIVTEQLSILDRIFNKFRSLITVGS